ncbi:hypothetical protein DH09_10855 [Bacillaceae bacterium JMAK1]|nr:hypothetical protein DH09_10855 [Bacillaceae bacterium JMAK1]
MQTWLVDVLTGIGMFFVHPLTYVAIVAMAWVGFRRMKRERNMFHTSIRPWTEEWLHPLVPGVLAGILASVVVVLLGIVLSTEYLMITAVVYLVLLVVGGTRLLSPLYSLLIALFIDQWLLGFITYEAAWLPTEATTEPAWVLLLVFVLTIIEAVLLRERRSSRRYSPLRIKSSRGKWIGGQRFDRLYLIPLFVFVPGELVTSVDWWPFLPVTDGLSVTLVPFLLGAHAISYSERIGHQLARTSTQLLWIAALAGASSFAIFYYPVALLYVVVGLLILRITVQLSKRIQDRKATPYFTPRADGVVILAVRPGSPAEKMGLIPGEIVTKVHQEPVNSEWSFYQKLQINPAYGKVEVVDERGEKRIEQAALYDNEHHELGIVFLRPEMGVEWQTKGNEATSNETNA